MSEGYARGGYVPDGSHGSHPTFHLDDAECVLDRNLTCLRNDDRHHREMHEISNWGGSLVMQVFGRCIHRHTLPVESALDGEVLARLCRHCDEQLPA